MRRYFARNNERLLFGTDTTAAAIYANPPASTAFYEMRRWIAAGVTTQQLFRAATIENARIMRLDREIGTIEKGKRAPAVAASDCSPTFALGERVTCETAPAFALLRRSLALTACTQDPKLVRDFR